MASNIPKDDKWELFDNDSNSQHYGKKFKFDFSYIESESIKRVAKGYVWRNYREGNLTLSSLYLNNSFFHKFIDFINQQGIIDLKQLTNNHIDMFVSYLNTLISPKGKPYVTKTKKNCLDTVKSIIRWGQLYMPNEVPKTEIFTGNEYIGVNRKLKVDYIPDEVLSKINIALKNENNPYVKYGIIILQSTGMRIGGMLKLTIDCIKPHLISGYTLTWYDYKNRKERQPIPITNECAMAVEKLIEHTKELREKTDDNTKNYLFIHKVPTGKNTGEIMNLTSVSMKNWFNILIKSNDIRDTNGELYKLSSHQFRRTLATDMFSKGTDLKVIQDVLGHSSAMTTDRHYVDLKDKERAEVFKDIGIIGNINEVDKTVIESKDELEWFNKNKEKGARLCDGYCTKPFNDNDEVCDRILKRQKCYTCKRYITTPQYLDAHKSHLEELEKQIEDSVYGEHYAEHFIPTIEILREIIKRLEELQSGDKELTSNN